MTNDDKLCADIREALFRDQRLSSRVIGVKVRDRTVTICGAPQSYERVLAAIEIAASFPECGGVVNKIHVRDIPKLDDSRIANLTRATLVAHPEISQAAVSVGVQHGEVTLSGTVATPELGILAEDIALAIKGVRSVRNLLLCPVTDLAEDAQNCVDVEAALKSAPGLRECTLETAIDGETLVVRGQVAEPWQKDLAEGIVERFRPLSVRDEIAIG
jgi:hyperosmotically inducible protein